MVFAQGLTAIIIFWAIIGGIGASLLLPAMQSLIHGNFEGAQQKRVYALVGASAAIAAAVGPAARRLHHDVPVVAGRLRARGRHHRRRALGHRAREGRAVHRRPRRSTWSGRVLSVVGMGGVVLGILVWQEGGEYVGLIIGIGVLGARPASCSGCAAASAAASRRCIDPGALRLEDVPVGRQRPAAAADRPRRHDDRAADLPADGARVQRAAGGALDRAAVAQHVRRRAARRARAQGAAGEHHPVGLRRSLVVGIAMLVPIVPIADSGWWLTIPLIIAGCGLGLLVSQLNNYTLSPISDERVSEAAGVNSAAGSFGLSFGLAFAGRDHARDARLHVHRERRRQHRALARRSSSRSRPCSRRTPRS